MIFFRKLSLTVKLLLVGIIPVLLLIYFSYIIYNEKTRKLNMMGDYIEQVAQSGVISELVSQLGLERRFSYHYVLKKDSVEEMKAQRLITDSVIAHLENNSNYLLHNFIDYTFLHEMPGIRQQVDENPSMNANTVVDFYTRAIFRLSTLNSWEPPRNIYSESDYQDIISQGLLKDMLTHLSIIRTNMYNVLYTREYVVETLFGTYGVYKTYQSYEKEFYLKASVATIAKYDSIKNHGEYKLTRDFVDQVFDDFAFDSTYNADDWWRVSTKGLQALKAQQVQLWKNVEGHLVKLYNKEKRAQTLTFIFLGLSVIAVMVFIFYAITSITKLLREIKMAARKISKGGTGVVLRDMPPGVIGNLAKSILQIEKNNLVLAEAASEIGKGNFKVKVTPRSEEDMLGMSIKKMKQDLMEFNMQKDKIQEETLGLVHQRDEFFSMTSHELKTPVTSLKAYTQLLLMDVEKVELDQRKLMLQKMDKQINKLVTLINDLLDTSRLQNGQLTYTRSNIKLNKLVGSIISEIQISHPEYRIIFQKNVNATVYADQNRISQVITNLLINAIKYAPESREIIVRMEKKESSVVCSIRDFGYGIRKNEQDRIFERFYRISGENLHTYPGLGLGLFISKQIIDMHDGDLWLESEYGEGSVFYFELPLVKEE